MKKLFFLCAAFLLAIALNAQDNKPVIIVSAIGKVGLISAESSKTKPLQSGAAVKNTGQLKLGKSAKATIFCNDQFRAVSGGQTVSISSLCNAERSGRKLDADFAFGEKLMEAVYMVDVAKQRGDSWANAVGDPKKSGDGWGNAVGDPKKSGDGWVNAVGDPKKSGDGWGNAVGDPKKSGDGWGGKGSTIRLILPFNKVLAASTTFFWSKPETKAPYKLIILNESGNRMHEVMTKDTFVTIDLKALNLVPEQIYRWKVIVEGAKPLESDQLDFGLGAESDFNEIMKTAKNTPLSTSAQSPVLGSLVEAVALENGEWHYAAYQMYAKIPKDQSDGLVRMMYAAFWRRNGYYRLAEKAARGGALLGVGW